MKFVLATVTIAGLWLVLATSAIAGTSLSGTVMLGGAPVSKSAVTVWVASDAAPRQVGQAQTSDAGTFSIDTGGVSADAVAYVIAKGGSAAKASGGSGLVLATLLGSNRPDKVVVNELTTVAAAFTAARFIDGDAISGNALGLRIAAGNAPNLVDPATGGWGHVLVDPLNSTQNTTLANLDTLGALVTAFASGSDSWRAQFLKASTPAGAAAPSDTFAAMAGIARESYADPAGLYALFDQAYPQPKDGARRPAPFVPYLAYAPPDFALMLCFAGGGTYSAGRLMFDADGNLWSGQNWMAGSQSGVVQSIGGGVVKMASDGTPLSPPITGFTGMGIDGVGWGTAVTRDAVWASSFNGKLLVMDFNGHPIATESDLPFHEHLLGLMGIGVAANDDVWVADGSDNQLLYFPKGRVKDGRIVKVAGLKSPFDIVIDGENRVWVSNTQSDTVFRFPANDPTKVESFRTGLGPRALALDSKGNVWVASNMSLDFPVPKIPSGASIMVQFELLGNAMLKYPKPTGVISMITPDGTQPSPMGYTGNGAVDIPWGLNVDGNDDVWAGNFSPLNHGVVLMAGVGTNGHPAGTKAGDVLHLFKSGSIQLLTDVSIDAAGNVWAANNWNDPVAATSPNPAYATSTWGGGSGITVIYGAAAPVKPPRIGAVQRY